MRKVLASSGKEKVALYEKEVEIKAACLVSRDAKPGSVALKFHLSYQACNDNLCRAPAHDLEIPLSVADQAAKKAGDRERDANERGIDHR